MEGVAPAGIAADVEALDVEELKELAEGGADAGVTPDTGVPHGGSARPGPDWTVLFPGSVDIGP